VVNLGFYHIGFIDARDPDDVYHMDEYLQFLADNSEGYRVYDTSTDDILLIQDNNQIIYGIYTIGGYNPLNLEFYTDLVDSIHNLSHNQHHPILDLLSVKYILTSERLHDSGFDLVYHEYNDGTVFIYENPKALRKAFIVHEILSLPEDEVYENVVNISFAPSATAFVNDRESAVEYSSVDNGSSDLISIEETSDNEMNIEITTANPGILIMGQGHYPAWNAYIDGERTEVVRVDHALMGVYIEYGHHNVTFICENYI